jgi:hypothetical protein
MTVYLCSCGFATDDPDWFEGHQFQHPGHHQRRPWPAPPPPGADPVRLPVRP